MQQTETRSYRNTSRNAIVGRSKRILVLAMLGIIALCVGLVNNQSVSAGVPTSSAGIPTANQAAKINPVVLQETADGKSASVMVVLADQADVNSANAMRDQDARGWYVYNTLTQHAERTQAALRSSLDAQGIRYTSFWAVNSIVLTVDRPLLETLAARNDVGKIESNKPTRWIEDEALANFQAANDSPNAIEIGVQNVKAPEVWAQGFRGQGIVIGGLDTGIRWTHNSIKNQYRGWNGVSADHNYNWHDSIHSGGGICGPNSIQPCDDNTHGTHTVGTVLGDDGNPGTNQIGVAPGAKWVGCRNMDVGNGTPATYTECFQWTIAPTDLAGNNPNPALRPHILNNSWGCPASEGCAPDTLETIVNNTQAAGIFVVVSAGNSGPSCGSVSTPAAIYEASFTVGAISASNNTIAGFSSRGPVTVDGSNRMKPNISAPGVNVRSATNASDTAYGSLSGTSMAGPHVAGVAALLWSAHPSLVRDIATTKSILQNTANPNVVVNPVQTCGGIPSTTIPNNTFGYGRVDALAAVNSVSQGTPTPSVTVVVPTSTTQPTVAATSTTQPTVAATSTGTVVVIPTITAGATSTVGGSTATAVPTSTPCTITFTDVDSENPFYTWIRCLACRGIISGYSDGTFRPNAEISRGQIAKMVSNSAGFGEDPGAQIYEDVPSASPFYAWINRLSMRGHMGGYNCGIVPEEPCGLENRPYFRPSASATRGQLAKIVSNAAGLTGTSTNLFYTDVQLDNPFYVWIMRLTNLNVMSGYTCGGPNEPCDEESRPYFRPYATVTRGQASKIVANTFFPNCETPRR